MSGLDTTKITRTITISILVKLRKGSEVCYSISNPYTLLLARMRNEYPPKHRTVASGKNGNRILLGKERAKSVGVFHALSLNPGV